MKGGDNLLHLRKSDPVGEAVGPHKRVSGDRPGVVGLNDSRNAHLSLVVLTEVDRVASTFCRVGEGGRRASGWGDQRRCAVCGVYVGWLYVAVDHDGGTAFAAPDLGESTLDFLVRYRILS